MADGHIAESTAKPQPPSPELFENYSRTAPNFEVRLRELQDKAVRQEMSNEGPIARSGVPMVELFDSNTPHKPNETVTNDRYAVHGLTNTPGLELHYGKLELHYGADGQPASAHFVDQNGNVEEIAVNPKDPSKIASDTFEDKQTGLSGSFTFADGNVTHQTLTDQDRTISIDTENGFHYGFQSSDGRYDLTLDASGARITTAQTPADVADHKDDPNYEIGEKFDYNKSENGQPTAIEVTRTDGTYRATRGANGAWQITKLEPQ
jgi:hypothetical protein